MTMRVVDRSEFVHAEADSPALESRHLAFLRKEKKGLCIYLCDYVKARGRVVARDREMMIVVVVVVRGVVRGVVSESEEIRKRLSACPSSTHSVFSVE